MSELQAIPTTYEGVQFRSRLEARFAEWLTEEQKAAWVYEPKGFTSAVDNGYQPDFYIPCIKTYVEIKPRARKDEIEIFFEHIEQSSHNWIMVDRLEGDRDRWTIMMWNGAALGKCILYRGNYFTIGSGKHYGRLEIWTEHIDLELA